MCPLHRCVPSGESVNLFRDHRKLTPYILLSTRHIHALCASNPAVISGVHNQVPFVYATAFVMSDLEYWWSTRGRSLYRSFHVPSKQMKIFCHLQCLKLRWIGYSMRIRVYDCLWYASSYPNSYGADGLLPAKLCYKKGWWYHSLRAPCIASSK